MSMSTKLWIPKIGRVHQLNVVGLFNRAVRKVHDHGRPKPTENLHWIGKLLSASEGGGYDIKNAGIVGQTVSWGEQDVFQHINNVAYLRWFENARVNLFYNVADEHPEMLEFFDPTKGVGPVMRSVELAWRRPIVYPDRITVVHKVGPITEPDRFVLHGVVVSHNQKVVAARIKETLVCIDQDGRKAPIPIKVRSIMEDWIKEQNLST
jgi:YbgC/YbaW family acyl-CoA thioester hydrolase